MLKTDHYCITTHNVRVHELIGLKAEVSNSTDARRIGLKGTIVDETKNTFTLDSCGKEKVLPKKEITLTVSLGDDKATIDGKSILYRPEERTKKKWRNSA